MKLLGSNILVKRKSMGGVSMTGLIIVPDNYHCDQLKAEVLAVGPGELTSYGRESMGGLQPGDIVLCYPAYGHDQGNNEYIVDITEIEAIVKE
jgi:co-chaperonin GroES (HSP10)